VKCVFNNHESYLDVPVGDGDRTFKWLGLAAARNFAVQSKPNGRRRCREIGPRTGLKLTSARLLPSRVCSYSQPFLHPDKLLCDELSDGDEVLVMLTDLMPVYFVGRPDMDRWMRIAFEISTHMQQHREAALQEVSPSIHDQHARARLITAEYTFAPASRCDRNTKCLMT
jgi:hypothetical protein